MSTVTFRVTDEEKAFIQSMADLNGLSLSELARTKLLEGLEDRIDMALYEKAMKAHELNDESISHQDMLRELGL
ncbi:type II toxin-antitoxin system RelB family antitoxin [Ruoffia tabacinasalis]|uniref:type II toxin-antitoxin system RelB family antitoxin n=1 Tax=Ruoffia tabacinasalis TaxID=87458 RepID=UPI0030D4EAA3